ncbi:hypothetical protein DPMN_182384 [Dreissena polymorpha]|uniref:Uncharacterized protein n=1 Tax=Dreissena polymorpha TaxID=45954 RepID=A0A9D4DFC7_DREPO|nr:hypothetical protein DPMN_182384 [Dreissena polymorpha]
MLGLYCTPYIPYGEPLALGLDKTWFTTISAPSRMKRYIGIHLGCGTGHSRIETWFCDEEWSPKSVFNLKDNAVCQNGLRRTGNLSDTRIRYAFAWTMHFICQKKTKQKAKDVEKIRGIKAIWRTLTSATKHNFTIPE